MLLSAKNILPGYHLLDRSIQVLRTSPERRHTPKRGDDPLRTTRFIKTQTIETYFPVISGGTPHPDAPGMIEAMIDDVPFIGTGNVQDGIVTRTIDTCDRILFQQDIIRRHFDRAQRGCGTPPPYAVIRTPCVILLP